jgi:hypothetical protein
MHEWTLTLVLALPLVGTVAGADLQAQGAGNPACGLLTAADLGQATGRIQPHHLRQPCDARAECKPELGRARAAHRLRQRVASVPGWR